VIQKQTESHIDECSSGFQHYAAVTYSDFSEECAACIFRATELVWVAAEGAVMDIYVRFHGNLR
jgi:hypothetical protein